MNRKHGATLAAIFATPTPANIRWREIESLFAALGADIKEGAGSRVSVRLNNVAATFHRPHPQPDASRATARDVRDFLEQAGVKP